MSIKSIQESKWLTVEQKNVATRELNDKLRLEKMLDAQLRPIMNRMNKDFKRKYAATGSVVDFSLYRGDISATLRKHYDRVQKTFKSGTKQATNQELADLGLAEWQAEKLVTQPEFIINTTQKDANKSVREAMNSILESGAELTALGVATVAAVFNRRKLYGRLSGITITETQTAAESTKLIEAQALSGRTPFTVRNDPFSLTRPREEPIKDGSKQWITVGDRNVRASHVSADKQTVDIDDPFDVGGYKMRHPADTSLGAPVKEWVNCRCSSNIKVDF